VSHTKKLLRFFIVPNAAEKQLAHRPMRSKRIEIINTTQSVPKKNKIVQAEIGGGPPEAGGSTSQMKIKKTPTPARTSTIRKSAGAARKKTATARNPKVSMPPEADQTARPSDEEIRMRAYFISERRRRFALPGDADSDWLEAKRQLLSEIGPR
jgi:Protein of unknown function (DUF2934).